MNGGAVRLSGLPVRQWLRLQEHTDALMREHRLMAQQQAHHPAPPALLALFEEVRRAFPGSAVPELRMGIKAALDAGNEVADVRAVVTREQAATMRRLHVLLSEIDDYCRSGVLLTLPLEPAATHLRGWVVDEVSRQLDGAEPRRYELPA